jgi:hypothetical protein
MRLLLLALALSFVSASASAQDPALAGARAALATYDLEGPSTLGALRDLGPVAARGGSSGTEARYLRAIAGADLFTLSVALPDDALAARLADALGVTAGGLDAHLRTELAAVRTGVYRGSVVEELQLLDLTAAFERGDLSAISAAHGPRADALRVLALAGTASTPAGLRELPDARAARFPGDRDVSAALAAIETASAARGRVVAAAGQGDPWLAHLAARVSTAMAQLTSLELHPRAAVPEGLVAGADVATGTSADAVLVFGASSVSIGCAPIVTMADGATLATRTVSPSGHCTPLPELGRVALGTLPAVPRSIEALASALTAAELSGARSIALAPAPDAPLHVLVRILLTLESAGITPTHVALRAADGTLAMTPIRVVHAAALGAVDLSVHLRLGGYTVQRGRGREVSLPRVRGSSGLEFDHASLERTLRERPPASVAIDGMTSVAGSEIVQTARIAEASGASVTIVLP